MITLRRTLLPALALVASIGSPALAQSETPVTPETQAPHMGTQRATPEQMSLYHTQVPPLAVTRQAKTRAAAAYMDDALALLNMAQTHLQSGDARRASVELTAVSGKLTDAYLYGFHDRRFSARVQPLTLQANRAALAALSNPEQALNLIQTLQPEVASIYSAQYASLSGGGGGGGSMRQDFAPLRSPEQDADYGQPTAGTQPLEQD